MGGVLFWGLIVSGGFLYRGHLVLGAFCPRLLNDRRLMVRWLLSGGYLWEAFDRIPILIKLYTHTTNTLCQLFQLYESTQNTSNICTPICQLIIRGDQIRVPDAQLQRQEAICCDVARA